MHRFPPHERTVKYGIATNNFESRYSTRLLVSQRTSSSLGANETEDGPYSLIHLTAPSGFQTPYHLHQTEDEAFYLLDGELEVICAGKKIIAGAGSYVFLPRGVPHGFRCSSDKDSQVLIHAIPGGKIGFVGMMLEMVTPIHDRRSLPEAIPPDLEKLAVFCEKNKISILGPLPI